MAESSLPPTRLHPAWIILGAVRSLRALILPLAIALFTGSGRGQLFFLAIGGLFAAWGIATQAATWWRFRYEVAGGELRVRSGLLAQRERSVPLERIQAVDTAETPLQRAFGLVQLRVETAAGGAGGSDVTLEALTRADAAALRAALAVNSGTRPDRAVNPGTPAPTADAVASPVPPVPLDRLEPELIRALSPGELLLAGATSGRIGPAMALLAAGAQFADDLLPDWIWERLAMSAPGFTLRWLLLLAFVVGLGAWLLAIGGTVLTFANFELRRDGDRLLVSHGLLDRRRSTIPLARVQALVVDEGLLRQPFGLVSLRAESAGYGRDTAESGVLFPLLRRAEVPALLERTLPAFALALAGPAAPALAPLPARARSRYVVGAVWPVPVVAIFTTAAAWRLSWLPWWVGILPLALVPAVAALGLLQFRDAGWTLDPADRLVVRGRELARRTVVLPRRRLQHRTVDRGPRQRPARLATFRAAVASGGTGGRVALVHLDETVAFDLLTRLGPRPEERGERPARPARALETEGPPPPPNVGGSQDAAGDRTSSPQDWGAGGGRPSPPLPRRGEGAGG